MLGISLNQLVQKAMGKAVTYQLEIIGDSRETKTKKRVKVA